MKQATLQVGFKSYEREYNSRGIHGGNRCVIAVKHHITLFAKYPIRGRHTWNTSAPYLVFGRGKSKV